MIICKQVKHLRYAGFLICKMESLSVSTVKFNCHGHEDCRRCCLNLKGLWRRVTLRAEGKVVFLVGEKYQNEDDRMFFGFKLWRFHLRAKGRPFFLLVVAGTLLVHVRHLTQDEVCSVVSGYCLPRHVQRCIHFIGYAVSECNRCPLSSPQPLCSSIRNFIWGLFCCNAAI